MNVWIVVVAAGALSYLLRVSMLVIAARARIPRSVEQAAVLAVPASFAALATTSLAGQLGAASAPVPLALATGVGIVAVIRSGSPRAAVLVGMPTLWVLSALQSV